MRPRPAVSSPGSRSPCGPRWWGRACRAVRDSWVGEATGPGKHVGLAPERPRTVPEARGVPRTQTTGPWLCSAQGARSPQACSSSPRSALPGHPDVPGPPLLLPLRRHSAVRAHGSEPRTPGSSKRSGSATGYKRLVTQKDPNSCVQNDHLAALLPRTLRDNLSRKPAMEPPAFPTRTVTLGTGHTRGEGLHQSRKKQKRQHYGTTRSPLCNRDELMKWAGTRDSSSSHGVQPGQVWAGVKPPPGSSSACISTPGPNPSSQAKFL